MIKTLGVGVTHTRYPGLKAAPRPPFNRVHSTHNPVDRNSPPPLSEWQKAISHGLGAAAIALSANLGGN